MKSFPDKIRIYDTIINIIKILNMKLIHQFVAALLFIYHAYATSTNTEPCDKKDDGGVGIFICLVVGFFIIKHSEEQRRDREAAYYDSDEDEEQEDSGDEADTEEDDDAEESEEETEQEEDDSDAEESEVETEEPIIQTRKSRRLGQKATLADSHS
mgnify:FL=1|tara:strand:+ start:10094 stop:10561 length:468 start_codon:yes stop_codon:yes gene_type:complete